MTRHVRDGLTLVAWFGGLLLVGGALWVGLLSPEQFGVVLLLDPGYLFVVAIFTVLLVSTYLVASWASERADR